MLYSKYVPRLIDGGSRQNLILTLLLLFKPSYRQLFCEIYLFYLFILFYTSNSASANNRMDRNISLRKHLQQIVQIQIQNK